jgi:toxin ParE1/3/4
MTPVVWTEPAIADLEAIDRYIARDSPAYATATVQRIVLAVDRLETFPLSGRPVREARDLRVRELLVRSYRVMYRFMAERVEIVAVVHAARRVSSLPVAPWRRP